MGILSLLLIVFSSICNSIMDTIVHHWSSSIFVNLNNKGWFWKFFHEDGWMNKYVNWPKDKTRVTWLGGIFNKPVQLIDGWHFFKSLMIIGLIGAIVIYEPIFNPILDFLVFGAIWNLVFNFFYEDIWRSK